jgi:RND family efflux transporter MFP subunit
VVTVARPDIREAVIDLADDVAGALQVGTPFTMRLEVDPTISTTGKVREIAPRADATTRTRRIRITLDDPPETMRLGTTVTATVNAEQRTVIRLPSTAVLEQDGKSFVWLVDGASKSVKRQEIMIARNEDGSIRVTSGLDAGQRVVTAGVHSLKDGQAVRIDQESQP